MITIRKIRLIPIQGAFTYDDITALQARSIPEADRWNAPAVTPGFERIRELATGVGLGLETDDGVFWGDCIAVSYSGKAGRQTLFRAREGIETIERDLLPRLASKSFRGFRDLMEEFESFEWHTAISYGLSQAVLKAVAASHRELPMLTLCREYGLQPDFRPVPIQGSCGNDRKAGLDKMIAARLSALPHTQVDDIPTQLGPDGEILIEYARWIVARIRELAGPQYRPTIHLDVHGAIGRIFSDRPDAIVEYLGRLRVATGPLALRVESVVMGKSLGLQIEKMGEIHRRLREAGVEVDLVADEWANTKKDILAFAAAGVVDMIHVKMPDVGGVHHTVEAVLGCQQAGVETLLGGSCIETEISTQVSVHVAMATRPTVFLAKPGMGVLEAVMLAKNEMARIGTSSRE